MPNALSAPPSVCRNGAARLAAPAILGRAHAADAAVQLISHRYPGLEYYADKLKSALPGVAVDTRLMQAPEAIQLQRLALSSGSGQLDILWANSITMASFAKSGWLEPLDDLWAKHKRRIQPGRHQPGSGAGCSYKGRIYGMPLTTNTMLYAYRSDLFEREGPEAREDLGRLHRECQGAERSAAALRRHHAMKSDMVNNEMHSVINTIGDGWFDKDWRPTFNDDRGVKAVETYKRLAQYCVPGFTAVHNDEHTINMGQDIAAQGQQWATRCSTMDNPDKSRVVGKIKWTVMPEGGRQVRVSDTYCISRFTAKDKDMLFRLLASALREENQRGACGAGHAAAQRGAERSGVAGEIPLVSGGVAMPGGGEAAAGAAGILRSLGDHQQAHRAGDRRADGDQGGTRRGGDRGAGHAGAARLLQVTPPGASMWLFMLPSLAVMTVVLVYPLASAIYYSFLRYYLGGGAPQFIGFANYVDAARR